MSGQLTGEASVTLGAGYVESDDLDGSAPTTVTSETTLLTAPMVTPAMHIGQVAARTELSLRTLRHYDEIGLLRPSGRTDGGFRLYTEADVEKILVIRRMKPLAFSLDEMSAAMRDIETLHRPTADPSETGDARERLTGILHEATERRGGLVRKLAMADEFIELIGQQIA